MTSHALEIRTNRRVTDNRQAPFLVEFFVEKVVDFQPGSGLFVFEIRDPENKSGDQFIRPASIVDVFNVASNRRKALLSDSSLYRTNYLSKEYEDAAEAKERTAQIERTINNTIETYRKLTDNWIKDNPETLEYPLSESETVTSLVDEYRDIVADLEAKKIELAVVEGRQQLIDTLKSATNLSSSVTTVVDEAISSIENDSNADFFGVIESTLELVLDVLEGVKPYLTADVETDYQRNHVDPAINAATNVKDSLDQDFQTFIANPVRATLESTLSGVVTQISSYEDVLADKKSDLDDEISQLESDKASKLDEIQAIDPSFEPGDIPLDLTVTLNNP